MNNPIKLIKKIWRGGMISLVVVTMVFGGLILNLNSASAEGTPNMTVNHVAANASGNRTWGESVDLNAGNEVDFYAEIHNTVVGTRAEGVKIKVDATGGNFVDGKSVATVSANNANSVSDTVNIHINGGGSMEFIPNSTRVTWDVNGDGNFEFKDTYVAGNPMSAEGLRLGQQDGCNNFIIQMSWAVRVKEGPKPSPSPSPSPTPKPTPSPSPSPTPTPVVSPSPSASPTIVINNNQEQKQEQHNNQTVNITTGQVAGAKIPAKTPETGVSVLGLTSMLGAGPVGFALSRFGRGRTSAGKREEESLSEIASRVFSERNKS